MAAGVGAVGADRFLSSLGVNTHVDQGYNANAYIAPLRYIGVRAIRDGQRHLASLIMLHQRTGVRVDLGAADVAATVRAALILAHTGTLLSVEGPNEPNNFPVTYKGQKGGGAGSWIPVAQLQKDLCIAVHTDPDLKTYPVFHVSEGGAETDNVGLQFLTIPVGAGTVLPEGTQFADYANPHNYVSANGGGYRDNQAWQAASPTLRSRWDGLAGEYGQTWRGHFQGYSDADLRALPRVSTETGWAAARPEEEPVQGKVLVNTYLAQFKLGWRYTFIYELGEDEGGTGNQGLFHKDWTPKLAATYIHNLTSILADERSNEKPGTVPYAIVNGGPTVHDLLLQKSGGLFDLVVWGERVSGENAITVDLGAPRARVSIYDTTRGADPIQNLDHVSSVPLTVGDHALVVEFR